MSDLQFKIDIKSDASQLVGAFQKSADATQDAAQHIDKLTEKTELNERSTRRLAIALGSELPGASSILESAFASMQGEEGKAMGATFLLIAGLEMLKDSIQKISAEKAAAARVTEELNDADSALTAVVDAEREAINKVEESEEEFYHNYLRNTQTGIEKTLELVGAMGKAAGATAQKNDDANKGIAEAQIEAMEQRGVVSHAAALRMKEQLDLEFDQRKIARMMAMDKLEQSLITGQLNNAQAKQHEDEAKEPQAAAAAHNASVAKAKNDAKIEDAKRRMAGGEEASKNLRASGVTPDNIEKLKEMYEQLTGGNPEKTPLEDQFTAMARFSPTSAENVHSMFGSYGDVNLANYEGAQLDVKSGQTELKEAQGKAVGLDESVSDTHGDLQALHAEMEKDKSTIADLQAKLQEKKGTDAINEGGAQADFNSQSAASALTSDRAAADQLFAGRSANAADTQKMIADASRIAGHSVDLGTAAAMIEAGANNLGAFMNQLNRLAAAMSQIHPGQVQQMQNQIEVLEQKVSQVSVTH